MYTLLEIIGTRDPECYVMEYGADYRGYKSIAEDGSTCLNWTITTSYRYTLNPMDYPDAGLGDHNYCRNPVGDPSTWCYVTENGFWAYCNINNPNLECTQSML